MFDEKEIGEWEAPTQKDGLISILLFFTAVMSFFIAVPLFKEILMP